MSCPCVKKVVLVVEDEPLLRMMAVDLVVEAGFEALQACHAADAIALLESRTDVCIIFTDIDMPGSMDGLMLAAAARRRWPPIKIIITSGHFDIDRSQIVAPTEFFAKPYVPQEIVEALRRLAA
jgi:CheY-like chemotaxis protein